LIKAAKTTEFILKKCILRVEDIINDEEKISHSSVSQKIKQTLENTESKDFIKFKKQYPDI